MSLEGIWDIGVDNQLHRVGYVRQEDPLPVGHVTVLEQRITTGDEETDRAMGYAPGHSEPEPSPRPFSDQFRQLQLMHLEMRRRAL